MSTGAPRLAPLVDFSADGLRRSLAESLERLGLDRVDIVYVHDPEGHIDTAIAALTSLRDLASSSALAPRASRRRLTSPATAR